MIIQCLLNEWMDFYLHYPSPSLSLLISFFLNDRNRPSIGPLLWIPLHPESFLPVPTQSYHGLHRRAPRGKEGKQGCSEKSPNPAPLAVKADLGTPFGLVLGQVWDLQTPSPLDPPPSAPSCSFTLTVLLSLNSWVCLCFYSSFPLVLGLRKTLSLWWDFKGIIQS